MKSIVRKVTIFVLCAITVAIGAVARADNPAPLASLQTSFHNPTPKALLNDFIHPTGAGFEIWADALQPYLDQVFGPPAK